MRRLLIVGALTRRDVRGGCDDIDRAVGTINSGITALQTTSASCWADVLTKTRDELIKQGQSTLAVEVTNILNGAVQAAGVEVCCYTEFSAQSSPRSISASPGHADARDPKPGFVLPQPSPDGIGTPATSRRPAGPSSSSTDTTCRRTLSTPPSRAPTGRQSTSTT